MSKAITGTTTITKGGVLKVDGKKYELTEAFKEKLKGILEKVDLNGRTLLYLLNKDNEICGFKFQGAFSYKEATPKFGKDGETYLANYVTAIGYPTKPKVDEEGKPYSFNLLCNEKKDEKPENYVIRAWEKVADRARIELAPVEGQKRPLIWVNARETTYKGNKYYTLLDFGVITD